MVLLIVLTEVVFSPDLWRIVFDKLIWVRYLMIKLQTLCGILGRARQIWIIQLYILSNAFAPSVTCDGHEVLGSKQYCFKFRKETYQYTIHVYKNQK